MSFGSEHALAVLVDIENMSRPGARNRGEFDIHLVLGRLAEKGRVVVKRAYADWSRYRDARRELMNAGLELIEMPSAREGAKNRADIKMAVDAMEIAYSRTHVSTFVIVSGDSDFTPLIGKLRELDKRVIGIGRDEASASTLLIANCDEFYFYDSMASTSKTRHAEGQRPDALSLLRETLEARGREGDEHPQASAVKDSMRRRDPAFSENDIGFSTFSKFLEDAQTKGIVRLVTDSRSGTYLVELADGATAWPSIGDEASVRAAERGGEPAASEGRRRRRRRRGGENGEQGPRETVADGAEEAEGESEGEAEVFEFRVPEREAVVEMPPLDQPLSYEDLLADPEPGPAASEEPPSRGSRRRRKPLSAVAEPDTADLEASVDEPVAEPAADAEEAVAPKRTRRRRASAAAEPPEAAAEASTETASTEAAAESSVASAEEAPTTGRRRVRRGSVLGTIAAEATPADEATAEEPAEEKPAAKRRTTRKKAEPADGEVTAAAEAAEESAPKRRTTRAKATAETGADEAAPKRRTTRKKADADEAASAPAADEDKPKRRRTTRKKAEDEAAAEGLSPKESPY